MFLLLIIFASKILIGGEDSYLGCLQKELRKFNRYPDVNENFSGNNIRRHVQFCHFLPSVKTSLLTSTVSSARFFNNPATLAFINAMA
jgi:hypothetical protein